MMSCSFWWSVSSIFLMAGGGLFHLVDERDQILGQSPALADDPDAHPVAIEFFYFALQVKPEKSH